MGFFIKRIEYETKNLPVALASSFVALGARAQTSDAKAEAIVNLLGVQKKEAIAVIIKKIVFSYLSGSRRIVNQFKSCVCKFRVNNFAPIY